jgi:hypothetical protein
VLVVAPGWAVWDLAQDAGRLATLVIWATKGCAALAGVLLLLAWFRVAGLSGDLADPDSISAAGLAAGVMGAGMIVRPTIPGPCRDWV